MTINKFNYEVYALDYLEGNLSVEMTKEMEHFLQSNPAIEAELSGMMEMVVLSPDTSIVYTKKADLLKQEKVVFLNRKWIRPLIAAASLALLIGTFFIGYQAGVNKIDTVAVQSSGSSSSEEIADEVSEGMEQIALEKMEKKDLVEQVEKVIAKQEKIDKPTSIIKNQNFDSNFEKNKLTDYSINENIGMEVVREKIATISQLADNKLIINEDEGQILPKIEPLNSPEIVFLNVNYLRVKSINDTLNDLNKALVSDLQIDKYLLVNVPKRKRNIKDFFGRFPISNLKEALIPSYYKEDTAGQ